MSLNEKKKFFSPNEKKNSPDEKKIFELSPIQKIIALNGIN